MVRVRARAHPIAFAFVTPLAVAVVFAALAGSAREARADVSSWMAIGGGSTEQLNRDTSNRDVAAALSYSIGVGSSPLSSIVVGGLLRGQIFLGLGTDLGLAARVATGGFARGDWGLALDAGVLWRPWRSGDYGEWPLQGVLTGGTPWGLQLALGADVWSVSGGTQAQGLLRGDRDRLPAIHRRPSGPRGEHWWPNPRAAGGQRWRERQWLPRRS